MTPGRCGAAAAMLAAALAAAGCGKKSEAPKVDAAAEQAAATERAKQRAYGGTEVKALEDAKKLEADMNQKAQARDPDSK
jgi:hypothetical protein